MKGISPTFIVIAAAIIIAAFSYSFILQESPTNEEISTIEESQSNKITFIVDVPKNTPGEDIIYIYIAQPEGVVGHKMEKIDKFTHRISFDISAIEEGADSQGNIAYRYSRNGWDYITAEFLEPDTNDYFWTELGRKTKLENGKIQRDRVERWRWFPEGEIPKVDVSELGSTGSFPARINGIRFRSGQGIQDLYIDSFDGFFISTAEHMRDVGYEWAVFYPAWQWTEDDPLPKMNNAFDINPNYPDEKLIQQMRDYKNAGLKIILAPQVCCTEINEDGRSTEWWEAYFDELERFHVHHAKMAEEVGAEAFVSDFARLGLSEGYGEDIVTIEQKTWSDIWKAVREVYSGEVGQMVWNFGVVKYLSITPSADFITWGDQLDFFYIQSEGEVTPLMDPTDGELLNGVERELDATKELYDKYGKPIIMQTAYHSVRGSWRGFEFIPLGTGCGESDPESSCTHEFSTLDQARAINAYFEGIKDRPWIVGYFHFGYWQWDMPMLPDWSIRGKAAEDVWKKWNNAIYKE